MTGRMGWFGFLRMAVVCGLVALSGCAATSITSQVETFGRWPDGRKPGTFVFDVLPSQQAHPTSRERLEAAALPTLRALGFQLADPAAAERADTVVQLDLRVRVEPRLRYEPYGPFGPYAPYGPRWHGAWGWWGPGWVASMDPPWVTLRVGVVIRDSRTHQVLYETHASHDRLGAVDESVLPYLFEAAFQGFPDAPPGSRVIDIPLPQEAH